MLYPDFKTYKKLSHRGNLIPIVKELILDRETPVSAFIKVSCNETSAFLLESVEYGEKIGRYSFIGFDPEIILEKNDDNIVVKERARGNKSFNRDDLLDVMKDILSRYKLVPVKNIMERRVVITGLGAVTPIGIGIQDFYDGLMAGKNGVAKVTHFDITNLVLRNRPVNLNNYKVCYNTCNFTFCIHISLMFLFTLNSSGKL